jgi:glucokinase
MSGLGGGIDVGGTKMQAAVVSEGGEVVGQARRPTRTNASPKEVVQDLAGAIAAAVEDAGVEGSALTSVGIGWPGPVDTDAGVVTKAVHLPELRGFPLADTLSDVVGAPVRLGNDVQVATDAEFSLGAGRPYGSILGVFWGTGVGGGIILDGRPWTGRGGAGEIGHVVVRENGRWCPCGRRGCLEAYAGRAAMEKRARRAVDRGEHTILFEIMEERGRDRLTSGVWERALRHGDPLAVRLLDRAVRALGTGIASALNLLDVEAVVLGGGLGVRLGERYLERIDEAVMPHLFADDRPPAILVAELGDLGGAIGAAMLGRSAS